MILSPFPGAVQAVTSYPDFKSLSSKLQSLPDKVKYQDMPIATATTCDDRRTMSNNYSSSNRASGQTIPQSTKSGGSRTFYYSGSHASSDGTYAGNQGLSEENARSVKEHQTSPTSPSGIPPKSPGHQNGRTSLPANPRIPARDSLSLAGLKHRNKKHTSKQESISEIPPVPAIGSHYSEGGLSGANLDLGRATASQNGLGHSKSTSSVSNGRRYSTNNRQDAAAYHDICCTQSHHNFLERKMDSLETKIDNLVPALLALTQALTDLSSKFESGAVAERVDTIQQQKANDFFATHNHTSLYGQPTPGPEEFPPESTTQQPQHYDEFSRTRYGSVSERSMQHHEASNPLSRRGSQMSKAVVAAGNDDVDERQRLHELLVKNWVQRPRQQSCFDPDTSDDDAEEAQQVGPVPSKMPTISSARRWSKPTTTLPLPSPGKAYETVVRKKSTSQLPVRPENSRKTSSRSAPPAPVKIFPIKTAYTARRGDGSSSANIQNKTQIISPQKSSTPKTLPTSDLGAYSETEMNFRENAPLPLVPRTAGLVQPVQVYDFGAPPQPSAASLPSTPRYKTASPQGLIPLILGSGSQGKDQAPRPRKQIHPTMAAAVHIPTPLNIKRATAPPRPSWYFLYGALADPISLGELFGLSSPPVLQPAHIQSHTLKYHGSYICAVSGASSPDAEVGPKNETRDGIDGQAWYIPSVEMAEKLRLNVPEGYYEVHCELEFLSGAPRPPGAAASESGVIGRMFEWRGPTTLSPTGPLTNGAPI